MNIADINTCYPARVVEFDHERQLASVQLSIEHLITGTDFSFKQVKKALVIEAPVQFPQGGGYDITFPVKEGDDCLVLFTQRGYDHWLYSDKQEAGLINGAPSPDHRRMFSAQDALVLVGFRPIPKAIKNFSTDGMDIRSEDKTQRISLKDNKDIEVETTGNIICKADGRADIIAPTINLTGTVNVNGDLNVSGATTGSSEGTFNGIAVSTHVHKHGVPNTSPPE